MALPLLPAALAVAAGAQAFGAQLRFESPTYDRPNYAIRVAFDVKSRPATITEVRLNGAPFGPALVFKDGKLADRSKPLDPGPYEILLDYAWTSAKTYTVKVYHQEKSPAKPLTFAFSATSPAAGGIPEGCLEGFSRSYRVSEEAGLARVNEIGYMTLTAPVAETGEPGFRVFDGSVEIPCQVLERREAPSPPNVSAANPPTATCKLAVSLNAAPNERKLLVVLRGRPAPLPEQGLALSGENLGKTLRTPRLVLQFHPQSGQILTIEYPGEQVRLWNKAGVIHWNPDVFIPGTAWDHSFDWNPPEVFEERTGGLVYLNSRRGPMPHIKDVTLDVRYAVDPGHPYFIAETLLTAEKDLGVIAVRNDEMVLYKELFDTLMYRDKDGRIVTMPLREKPEAPFGLVHVAPPDVPWAGLVNLKEGYGFFSLRLEAAASNLDPAGDFGHKSGTYFYAPSDGDYVYWVRPLLYTWGDYRTNNFLTYLPKGSFFYEKNAYILLRLNEGTPRELDTLLKMLRNPLRIF
ncbi:MAG: hypothetical protein ACXVI6_02985 [Candidatus Aminicenantales bacterium]